MAMVQSSSSEVTSVSISSNFFRQRRPPPCAGAASPDQIVGQHELGVAQPVEIQPDRALLDVDQHLVALDPASTPLKRRRPSISSVVSILAS
jgi:hypothetical protein